MTQIFGNFIEKNDCQEHLIINFSASSNLLQQRWYNEGLSVDFLADYLTNFFPNDPLTAHWQAEVKDSVHYVANELLENAMKFSNKATNYPVGISLILQKDIVRFYVTNSVDPESISSFQAFIQKILNGDPSELYIQQLESNARNDLTFTSRLGFLTLLNDYKAQLAWKFKSIDEDPEIILVTVMVQLNVLATT